MDGHRIKACFYCNRVVTPKQVEKDGCCMCGSRRLRVATMISEEDEARLKAEGSWVEENWADELTFIDDDKPMGGFHE